ncbi:MAG: biotin--[acetyl-CoA-carboxylase] ligase [Amylibacter sp.]|jgi:BirA family biotin operon repressor/biotin-[acetyl-CoA-carboxylase] ligase|tara:strand:- start:24011 stop:24742 length:732 start_codon:yes stop_codon:yes gene_type:complete
MIKWPAGVNCISFKTIDSTNKESARRAADTFAPLWILADEQSEGVGRRGRAWSSQKGNFSATLLMPISDGLSTVALYSFVASLALRDALVHITGSPERFDLKWPNDVLMEGGKVAGILLETCGINSSHLSIGIGVNLAIPPELKKIEKGSTPPRCLNGIIEASNFLKIVAHFFSIRETQFKSYGFASIRSDWLQNAAKLGEIITARLSNNEITGIFDTVDEQGGVVLQAGDTRHVIHAADIFF